VTDANPQPSANIYETENSSIKKTEKKEGSQTLKLFKTFEFTKAEYRKSVRIS